MSARPSKTVILAEMERALQAALDQLEYLRTECSIRDASGEGDYIEVNSQVISAARDALRKARGYPETCASCGYDSIDELGRCMNPNDNE